ncbi:hypothetical protein ABFT80_08145 [Mesorhizobium sp. SB112]|uniref:hypothetical protein n=1 Tax=Mesorhizobium sp. SB112 TaxID=3151853 RepID=UPI003262D5FF
MTRLSIAFALILFVAPTNAEEELPACNALAARLLDLGHEIDPSELTAANAPPDLVSAISRRLKRDEFIDCAVHAELSDELLMLEFFGETIPEARERLGR